MEVCLPCAQPSPLSHCSLHPEGAQISLLPPCAEMTWRLQKDPVRELIFRGKNKTHQLPHANWSAPPPPPPGHREADRNRALTAEGEEKGAGWQELRGLLLPWPDKAPAAAGLSQLQASLPFRRQPGPRAA